jgi:hypothetical protein
MVFAVLFRFSSDKLTLSIERNNRLARALHRNCASIQEEPEWRASSSRRLSSGALLEVGLGKGITRKSMLRLFLVGRLIVDC